MRISFLGLGAMGSEVARRLANIGYELTVWNRSARAADPLVALGAVSAASAAEAVRNASLVFTMVHDDHALRSVLFDGGALEQMPAGSTHVSLSTIGVALARELEAEHRRRSQHFVGCPVFGRPNIAAEGKLWLAIAGGYRVVQQVLPVLQTFSRGFTVVGTEPHTAHAVKLGGNFLITAMIASLSEALTYAEAQGMDPALFLETVNSALFQSPFYASYGKVMLHPPEKVAATVELGIKDTRLFQNAAAEAGIPAPLAERFAATLRAAAEAGHGHDDWAAGYLQQVRSQTQRKKETPA